MYNKRDICMICVMILVSLTSFMLYKTVSFGESLALAYTGNDIKLEKTVDLVANSKKMEDAKKNTTNLQKAIDKVSASGGGTVYLPAGTFYFTHAGTANDRFVIKLRSNVKIKGAGINENVANSVTILKPLYENRKSKGSLDMFYFNNYADTKFQKDTTKRYDIEYTDASNKKQVWKNEQLYLINADFEDFIIDGSDVHGGQAKDGKYDTTGKGFMINLFKDCDWNNVVVKNTDATGFGMDCPINSTITNSLAINCGKAADGESGGASGFGIGTGFSNEEYMVIKNSHAINNKKYGFFFEHQGIWGNEKYPATTAKGFVVSSSTSGGNKYNFGGNRANNVTYENISTITGNFSNPTLKSNIKVNEDSMGLNFENNSTFINVVNANIKNTFKDVTEKKDVVLWALNRGITSGTSKDKFNPNEEVTRAQMALFLYRMEGMPLKQNSSLVKMSASKQNEWFREEITKKYKFQDIKTGTYNYALPAIYWMAEKGLVTSDSKFRPNSEITKAELLTMLYRLAGSPEVDSSQGKNKPWYQKPLDWAIEAGIEKDRDDFDHDDNLDRVEALEYLQRYLNRNDAKYKITYNLMGGDIGNQINVESYTKGNEVKIKNPFKKGYVFEGWTGSNGSTPKKVVSTTSSSKEHLVFTANFRKATYNITYELDGGEFKTNPINEYDIDTPTFNLPIPAKKGYTFLGWTGSNGSTPVTNAKVTKGTSSNLSFKANFKKNVTSKQLEEIEVKKLPNKTEYYVGEKIDLTGLRLTLYYNDETKSEVDHKNVKASVTTLSKEGSHEITLTYNKKTTTYNVIVKKPELSKIDIKTKPKKLHYFKNDKFETNGLAIEITKTDGTKAVLTSGFKTSINNGETLSSGGKKSVTISYQNQTTTFDIDVENYSVNKIELAAKPDKIVYFEGETFDRDGLQLMVSKSDGTKEKISTGYQIKSEKEVLNKSGFKTVEVTYGGQTLTFEIEVNKNEIVDIQLRTDPDKLIYQVGDTFNTEGLSLIVKRQNGLIQTITDGYTLSIDKDSILNTTGKKKVTVTYEGKKMTFEIEVKDISISKIVVQNYPNQTTYYVGDKFSSKGLSLLVYKSNGYTSEINDGYTISVQNGSRMTTKGTKKVTVKYGGHSTTFNVEVLPALKNTLLLKSRPTKTNYLTGEAMDYDGMELIYINSNSVKNTVRSRYSSTYSAGTIFNSPGIKNIVITYSNQKVKFDVRVRKVAKLAVKEESIETNYLVGDKFDLSTLVLVAEYTDGTREEVSNGYFSSIKDGEILDREEQRVVNLTYGDAKAKLTINILSENTLKNENNNSLLSGELIMIMTCVAIAGIVIVSSKKVKYIDPKETKKKR